MEFIKKDSVKRIVTDITVSYKKLYEIRKVDSCFNCIHLDYRTIQKSCLLNKTTTTTICDGWEKNNEVD